MEYDPRDGQSVEGHGMPKDKGLGKQLHELKGPGGHFEVVKNHFAPKTKYDLLVFIGRFQPFHLGHQEVVEKALSLSKDVLILVGGAGSARSARNPWTYEERRGFIDTVFPQVHISPLHDHTYNDTAWINEVQGKVNDWFNSHGGKPMDAKIGLIGCAKDHTSYYLKMFPDWASEEVKFVSPLNATDIRRELFELDLPIQELSVVVDFHIAKKLYAWKNTALFKKQRAEYEYLREYKKQYGDGPFLTGDTLVQVGGKILVITRGKEYGNGLLALPGGFLGKYEKFLDGAIRELREETRLRVPDPVLRGSVKSRRVFDDPHRSARARLVTECFHIHLSNDTKLPEVRGSDDAQHAEWLDIADIKEDRFFEDHYHIIKTMLGLS